MPGFCNRLKINGNFVATAMCLGPCVAMTQRTFCILFFTVDQQQLPAFCRRALHAPSRVSPQPRVCPRALLASCGTTVQPCLERMERFPIPWPVFTGQELTDSLAFLKSIQALPFPSSRSTGSGVPPSASLLRLIRLSYDLSPICPAI